MKRHGKLVFASLNKIHRHKGKDKTCNKTGGCLAKLPNLQVFDWVWGFSKFFNFGILVVKNNS